MPRAYDCQHRRRRRAAASAVRPVARLVAAGLCVLAASLAGPASPNAGANGQPSAGGPRAAVTASRRADPRLQQKVWIHFHGRVADLLDGLSRSTGVALDPRSEIQDDNVTLWCEGRTLAEVMRWIRHLHGWYWSRFKRRDGYDYQLWQDAASRSREEAEVQRIAMEKQQAFVNNVEAHVKALHASESDLKRMARESDAGLFMVAEMKNPAIRSGYELFAGLSPDEQARLLWGMTPSHGNFMMPLTFAPRDAQPSDPVQFESSPPRGDVVQLAAGDLTADQRSMVQRMLAGALAAKEMDYHSMAGPIQKRELEGARGADPSTASVTFYRTGSAQDEELDLRLDFLSHGRPWTFSTVLGQNPRLQDLSGQTLRKALPKDPMFQGWPGEAASVLPYVGDTVGHHPHAPPPAATTTASPRDPVLDVKPPLKALNAVRSALNGSARATDHDAVLESLSRLLGMPVIADKLPGGPPMVFKRFEPNAPPIAPLDSLTVRGLLERFFPDQQYEIYAGAMFARDPRRLEDRLNAVPHAAVAYIQGLKGTFTLDELATLAGWLSPWQLFRLQGAEYLPGDAADQMVAAQELLQIYGDATAYQRAALAAGLPFAAMTAAQQQLFLAFAARQRPGEEPAQVEHGALRLALQPAPLPVHGKQLFDNGALLPVGRSVFQANFGDGDVQPFPVDLYPVDSARQPLAALVGQPFPFDMQTFPPDSPLHDARLRHKPLVLVLCSRIADPYTGTQPPPNRRAWALALALRLRDRGVTVALIDEGSAPRGHAPQPGTGTAGAVPSPRTRAPASPGAGKGSAPEPVSGSAGTRAAATRHPLSSKTADAASDSVDAAVAQAPPAAAASPLPGALPPNLLQLPCPGYLVLFTRMANGRGALRSMHPLGESPTVLAIDGREIVRGAWEGQDAWDANRVAQAASALAIH